MSDWIPSASIENLRARAKIIQAIRNFFAARQVLEVETPLLCQAGVTDPFIESMSVNVNIGMRSIPYFLQTSPEYAMKRLLAAGSGSIYQICKAFRQDEIGKIHNPEFTMLEWYRIGFDHYQLMAEMDELLQLLLNQGPAIRYTYQELFLEFLQIDPHICSTKDLYEIAHYYKCPLPAATLSKDDLLHLLLAYQIEPLLGQSSPCFIYNFPASQAALAKLLPTEPPTAARFEVYYQGIELANGFYELQDAVEQRQRFENNNNFRQEQGLSTLDIDSRFIQALEAGLPDCAGVAMGLDRLIMLSLGCNNIEQILSFTTNRA